MISPFASHFAESPPASWKPMAFTELAASQHHCIRSTAFHFTRLETAWKDLFNRWKKNHLSSSNAATLEYLFGAAPEAPISSPGPATIEFVSDGVGARVIASDQPNIADPRCWAALHLPGLRSWWAQALRGTHFQNLTTVLPNAWALEAVSVPPGSVIAGLDLPDWAQLPRCIAAGRQFVLWHQNQSHIIDPQTLLEPTAGTILIEVPPGSIHFRAAYQPSENRIEFQNLEVRL